MSSLSVVDSWAKGLEAEQTADAVWRMTSYRFAMYAMHLGWDDAVTLDRVRVTRPIGSQLYRALGSIAANLADGYSRSSGPDRARFFEYSLSSARESAVWYAAGRHVLNSGVLQDRLSLLCEVRRLVLASIPRERNRNLKVERGLRNPERRED